MAIDAAHRHGRPPNDHARRGHPTCGWGRGPAVTGVRRTAATVYEATIEPRVCDCPHQPFRVATGRDLDRVIRAADAYWALYEAFWPGQLEWLLFRVVDIRDGALMWCNGTVLRRDTRGQLTYDQ